MMTDFCAASSCGAALEGRFCVEIAAGDVFRPAVFDRAP
jgi:hypothetical protein